MKVQKVFIKMHDGTTNYGRVYLGAGQRLQDLLNDERSFVPVEVLKESRSANAPDTWKMSIVNKSWLQLMEEL